MYLHDLASGSTRRLDETDVAGGTPRSILEVPDVFLGAAWNRDDELVVSLRYVLYRMPAAGGAPTQVTTLDRSRQENSHRSPQFLPDGQRFVFVARSFRLLSERAARSVRAVGRRRGAGGGSPRV